jgi:hypothetical protein
MRIYQLSPTLCKRNDSVDADMLQPYALASIADPVWHLPTYPHVFNQAATGGLTAKINSPIWWTSHDIFGYLLQGIEGDVFRR